MLRGSEQSSHSSLQTLVTCSQVCVLPAVERIGRSCRTFTVTWTLLTVYFIRDISTHRILTHINMAAIIDTIHSLSLK